MVRITKRSRPKEKIPLRLAERRKRLRLILAILLGVLLVGLFFGAAYASHRPEFAIAAIEVSGTERVSQEAITAYAESVLHDGRFHLFSNETVFTYPRTAIETGLREQFLAIRSVSASVVGLLAPRMYVDIVERQPYARWCTDASLAECYLLDSDGLIFAFLPQEIILPQRAVFLGDIAAGTEPIGAQYGQGVFPQMRKTAELLEQSGRPVRYADAVDEADYGITLESGLALKLSYGRTPEEMLADMRSALGAESLEGKEHELEYIDLRFPGRVYFRLNKL